MDGRDPYKYEQRPDHGFTVSVQAKSSCPTNEVWQSDAAQSEHVDPNKSPLRQTPLYSTDSIATNKSALRNCELDSHGLNSSQTNHRLTATTSIQSASLSSAYTPTTSTKLPSDILSSPPAASSDKNFYPYNSSRELIDTSRARTATNDQRYNASLLENHGVQDSFPSVEESNLNANIVAPIAPGGIDVSQQSSSNSSYQLPTSSELSGNFMAYSTVADYDCSATHVNIQATNNARAYYPNMEGSLQTTEVSREGVFCYDKRGSKSAGTMIVSMALEQDHSSSSPIKYPSSLRSDIYSYGNCTDTNMNGNNWLTISSDGTVLSSQARHPRFNRHEHGQDYAQQADDFVHGNFHLQKQPSIQVADSMVKYNEYSTINAYKNNSNLPTDEANFDQSQRLESGSSFANHHLIHERALEQSAAQFPVTYWSYNNATSSFVISSKEIIFQRKSTLIYDWFDQTRGINSSDKEIENSNILLSERVAEVVNKNYMFCVSP